jgi:hypothetical protein
VVCRFFCFLGHSLPKTNTALGRWRRKLKLPLIFFDQNRLSLVEYY